MNCVLVGDGYWSKNFKRTLKLNFPDINISYIVDPLMKKEERNTVYLEDISQFEKHVQEVDFAIVCTPTITHFDIVKLLLENKIPTLVEKPITNNLEQAKELFELAKKNNITLMVDHVYLHNSSIKTIENIVNSGELGNVIHISFYRTNLGPIRTDVSALWDLTTHDISILNQIVQKDIESISASGFKREGKKVNDIVNVSIKYSNLYVTLFSSWLHPSKERIIKIVGDKKMLIFDEMNAGEKIKIFDKKIDSLNDLDSEKTGSYFSFAVGDIISPFINETDSLNNVLTAFLENLTNMDFLEKSKNEALKIIQTLEEIETNIQ
jgi:predicted dehydrogenase